MGRLFIIGLATLLLAGTAEAQACDEKCEQQFDPRGSPIGWACVTGGTNKFCQATTTQCSVTMCGGGGAEKRYTGIVAPDGRRLALVSECDVSGSGGRSLGALPIALEGEAEGDHLARGIRHARMEENRHAVAVAAP